jgi:hypothetical protein
MRRRRGPDIGPVALLRRIAAEPLPAYFDDPRANPDVLEIIAEGQLRRLREEGDYPKFKLRPDWREILEGRS